MRGMKPRVLVVDDDERIAASVRRALDYAGYNVSVAHNGPAAVAAAGSGDPDLIVLDVMMPGYDGLEVARRLRRAGNNTPILMLTARTSVPDRVDGLEAGADDYLIKPFAHDELPGQGTSVAAPPPAGGEGDPHLRGPGDRRCVDGRAARHPERGAHHA